jgi:hypothetical protein
MSTFPYKNPISSEQLNGVQSVERSEVFGTNFSVLSVGGYMEVFNLSDLNYTINGLGPIEYSGNSIPIDFLKGTGAPWSPDVLTLNSDNISSGRRRLGMLVYVYEVDQVYQYRIDNYESLWTAATASPGTVVISDFGTTVYNSSVDGQNFINAWTASTIEDVSGYTHSTAVWKKYTISGTNLSELYLPLSGGTVSGGTIFQSGLTANTISATTYQNLPTDVYVTGGTYTNGEITFLNNTGGTFTVTGLPIGGPGGQVYYLNLSNSQPPYQEFSPSGTTNSQQITAVTINNGVTSTITSFQTPTGYPNASLIPAGYWSFYLHSFKQNSNASFNIFCEVYLRTTGGTETLLVTTDPTPVTTNSPNPSMQLTDGYYSGSSINTTDRIVVKVRATNTGNQSHSITLVTEGTQHYSYGITPFSDNTALTCDTLSGCSTIQTIQTNISNKFDKSGGTVNGNLTVTGSTSLQDITATTISATTYQNLPSSQTTYVFNMNSFAVPNNSLFYGLYLGGTPVSPAVVATQYGGGATDFFPGYPMPSGTASTLTVILRIAQVAPTSSMTLKLSNTSTSTFGPVITIAAGSAAGTYTDNSATVGFTTNQRLTIVASNPFIAGATSGPQLTTGSFKYQLS